MGDQRQSDREQEHERRNKLQKEADELRRREGIAKQSPSKERGPK
jgi:hypothetical protein